MVYNGKPYQNGWFGVKTHYFWNHPYLYVCMWARCVFQAFPPSNNGQWRWLKKGSSSKCKKSWWFCPVKGKSHLKLYWKTSPCLKKVDTLSISPCRSVDASKDGWSFCNWMLRVAQRCCWASKHCKAKGWLNCTEEKRCRTEAAGLKLQLSVRPV